MDGNDVLMLLALAVHNSEQGGIFLSNEMFEEAINDEKFAKMQLMVTPSDTGVMLTLEEAPDGVQE